MQTVTLEGWRDTFRVFGYNFSELPGGVLTTKIERQNGGKKLSMELTMEKDPTGIITAKIIGLGEELFGLHPIDALTKFDRARSEFFS